MWTAIGFLIAVALGTVFAVLFARRDGPVLGNLPWSLPDLARQHVIIMGVLGGFSMTGLVVIVALTRSQADVATASLGTAVLMLVVSINFFVCTAFLLSYLPSSQSTGEVVPRLHVALCSTMEYRTIFLACFALIPLLRAHGLEMPARTLALTIPVLLIFNTIIMATVADGVGLMRFGETCIVTIIAATLCAGFVILVRFWPQHTPNEPSAIVITLAVFCINGLSFALVGLTPAASRYPSMRKFLDRNARRLVIGDMQVTMVAQAFLWLAVSFTF